MHLFRKWGVLAACLSLMMSAGVRADESVQLPAPSLDGSSPAAAVRAPGVAIVADPVYPTLDAARAAAERGEAAAQFQVGQALQDEKRPAEARQWFERAAAQDHPAAIHRLARIYEKGEGVAADPQKGFELSLKAAQLGWAEAMWDVANSYGAGRVAPRDLLSACTWILRAREHAGDDKPEITEQARQVLPYLERALSLAQVAACRKQALEWPPTSVQAVQPEVPSGPVAGAVASAGATRMVAKYVTVVRNGKKVRTKVMVAVRDSGRRKVAARGTAGKRSVVAAKGGKAIKAAAAKPAKKAVAGVSKQRVTAARH